MKRSLGHKNSHRFFFLPSKPAKQKILTAFCFMSLSYHFFGYLLFIENIFCFFSSSFVECSFLLKQIRWKFLQKFLQKKKNNEKQFWNDRKKELMVASEKGNRPNSNRCTSKNHWQHKSNNTKLRKFHRPNECQWNIWRLAVKIER